MKKMIMFGLVMIFATVVFSGCRKRDPFPKPAKKFASDVAIEWMKLNMNLSKTTPGFNSVVSGRSFGYAGLTLYESIVPAIRDGYSITSQLSDGNALKQSLPRADKHFFQSCFSQCRHGVHYKSIVWQYFHGKYQDD